MMKAVTLRYGFYVFKETIMSAKQKAYLWILLVLILLAMSICGIVVYAHNISAISAQPTPIVKPATPTVEPTFIMTYPTPMPTATHWTVQPVHIHPTPAPVIDGNG
jgi:hypothetical protein